MKRKPLRSVQSLFKALIYGAACLFLLFVFSCSDEMTMGSLNFGGDLFDGIQNDLSSDCLVELDGYSSCHVKMPFKKTYTKDALIDFFKKNRLLSAVNPGYYPENWKFDGFQDSALDASTNIDKSRFYTNDGAGYISVLTVPPYDFILQAGSWKIRTDTPYTVVFLFQSAEDTDIYEQLDSYQPFPLFGGTGVAFNDAFVQSVYENNKDYIPAGFEYEGLDPSSDTEIKADGTSVLKIRLKRKSDVSPVTIIPEINYGDIELGNLSGRVWSKSANNQITMTLSEEAKDVINASTTMTATLYYIADDKLVETPGGVGVDGYTAGVSEEFKLAFAETLDVGVYTLVISASDVRISTFSCVFTVTY